jgi:hypothetical protein
MTATPGTIPGVAEDTGMVESPSTHKYRTTKSVGFLSTVIPFDGDPLEGGVYAINPHTPPGCAGMIYDELVWFDGKGFVRGMQKTRPKDYPEGTAIHLIGIAEPE